MPLVVSVKDLIELALFDSRSFTLRLNPVLHQHNLKALIKVVSIRDPYI